MMKRTAPSPPRFSSAPALFGILLLIVFAIETLVMFLLPYLLPHTPHTLQNFFDSFLLALLSAPFIWHLVARSRLRQAEEVLRESEKRYHSLFENMLEGCAHCRMLFDQGRPSDFVYLSVNGAFGKLTGMGDVVGKRVTEVIPGIRESHPELFEMYGRVALTGTPEKFEIYLEPLDMWLSVSVYSIQKEHFVSVFDNITERKRAEGELHDRMRQAALVADVGVALTAGDNLQAALMQCAEAICTRLDAAFARIWTFNEQENILELQASAGMYTHTNGPHGRIPVGTLKIGLIAQRRKPHLTNAVVGDPMVSDQGWALREGMVAFAGHPLVLADKLFGVMALFSRKPLEESTLHALSAISDQIALGIARMRDSEALRERQAQIIQQEKLASIGQLAAGVAHEINNPIGFIGSNLGTLAKYLDKYDQFIALMDEAVLNGCGEGIRDDIAAGRRRLKIDYISRDIRQLIADNIEGTERVKKIVRDLKTFSHNGGAEMVDADINQCLESTINIVWNEIKYVATLVREYGDIPRVRCNPQQLGQVFLNLLVNAAHAIEKQGEITVRTWLEGRSVCVAVSDTGCGIPHADYTRIFDAFYTTKEIGKGTGLGLSISAEIVKKHSGEIGVASEVGKGTTFTVRLPVGGGKATRQD
ncbi:MAG TPA: ATP-binding protein [Geobacteraceae bacterium]